MSYSQGEEQGAENMPMPRSPVLPSAFIDQLMVLVDPHQATRNDALQTAQSACGRWIGLRRLHIGLSNDTLAGMLGITTDNLLLIETGLATPQLISEAARERLSVLLAPNQTNTQDKAWTADVIGIALGQIKALNEATLNRVFNELELASMSPEERNQMLAATLVEQPTPNQAAELDTIDQGLLQREPTMFEVLRVVINGATDIQAASTQLRKHAVPVNLFQLGVLLNRMQRERLIVTIGEQIDPTYPDESLPIYQVTPGGRQAFNAERSRRLVLAATTSSNTADDPLPEIAPPNPFPKQSG